MDRQTRYRLLEEVAQGDGAAAKQAVELLEKMQEEDADAVSKISDE